jgi:hypothetical protein
MHYLRQRLEKFAELTLSHDRLCGVVVRVEVSGVQVCACVKYDSGHTGSRHLHSSRNTRHTTVATSFRTDAVILECLSTSPQKPLVGMCGRKIREVLVFVLTRL